MRRVLLALLAVWALFFAGRWLLRALTPPEDRIRAVLAESCEAFGEGETRDVLDAFASDFRAEPSGLDRDELWDALRYLWLRGRDRGGWPYDARTDPAAWEVELEPDGGAARVAGTLELVERGPGTRTERWTVRVEGRMAEREGRWQWVRAEHVDEDGRPFR